MPPQLLFDISGIDLNHVEFGPEEIRQQNPHRGNMELLNAVVWVDSENHRILGYKDVRDDEFWVAGHIPGRPLFPGVLMWRMKSPYPPAPLNQVFPPTICPRQCDGSLARSTIGRSSTEIPRACAAWITWWIV